MRDILHNLFTLACILLLAGAAASAEVERDDPGQRQRAMLEWRGEEQPAARWRILQEAGRERDRYGGGGPTFSAFQAVQGNTFVNIGPASADYQFNGSRYLEIDSGRARQVVPHPTNSGILYLSTAGGGVWKTWDAGAHWEPITDMLGTTAVGALAMDPLDPDILYLGFGDPFDVHQPGLVRSTDGGATWSAPVLLNATWPGPRTAARVTDLKVDPENSAVVFATTDVGLFRSIDAGASWQQQPLAGATPANTFFFMWSIIYVGASTWLATGQVADPTKPVSAYGNAALGLWRSTDGGATWSWNAAALPGGDLTAASAGRGTLAIAPSTLIDPPTTRVFLLAGSVRGERQLDLFRSDDAGQSFQALAMNASGRPANPNDDQTDLDVLHQQAWYNQALLVDPLDPDLVFVGGDLSLVRSTDGGNSWSVIANWLPGPLGIPLAYVHADLHSLAVGADGALYAGSDGGIFVSHDARINEPTLVTFSSTQNRGLVTHLLFTVACAPETWPADMQGWVGGGMQDNGTRVRTRSTTVFNQVLGGDGIGLAVSAGTHLDPTLQVGVPDALLASAEFKLFRSVDGGQTWTSFTLGMGNNQLPFFVRLVRDTADPDGQAFLTYSDGPAGVFRSVSGMAWKNISGPVHWQDGNYDTAGFVTKDGGPISLRNIAVHPGRAGVYGVISNKFAYVTSDGGTSWLASVQPAPPGAPAGTGIYQLSSLAFDPADPTGNTYYLTAGAMELTDARGRTSPLPESFGHLYKTSDRGLHWTSLGAQPTGAGGLPFVSFKTIAVDPGDSSALYVGTALGLYRSQDAGATWARFGAGSLPLVEVTDICISPAAKRLTVATYGRGFWQIGTGAGTDPAGLRGSGDTNFDQRIDGLDLIDLADALGTTQVDAAYRWQADLTGTVNAIDNSDLAALLAKFGGLP